MGVLNAEWCSGFIELGDPRGPQLQAGGAKDGFLKCIRHPLALHTQVSMVFVCDNGQRDMRVSWGKVWTWQIREA